MARTTKTTTTYTCDRCRKQSELVETPTGLSSVGSWIELALGAETIDLCDTCKEAFDSFMLGRPVKELVEGVSQY